MLYKMRQLSSGDPIKWMSQVVLKQTEFNSEKTHIDWSARYAPISIENKSTNLRKLKALIITKQFVKKINKNKTLDSMTTTEKQALGLWEAHNEYKRFVY